MDPLSVISLASSILTFLDFSCKLISKGKEIHSSATGSLLEHNDIKDANERMKILSHELLDRYGSSPSYSSKHEQAIKQVCFNCVGTAQELNDILERLIAKPGQQFSSVRKAMESVWKDRKIRRTEEKLKGYFSELNVHLSAALTDRQSDVLRDLEKLTRLHIELQVQNKNELHEARKKVLAAIAESRTAMSSGMQKIDELTTRIDSLIKNTNNFARENRMLEYLRFRAMRVRQRNISQEHSGTMEWIFSEQHASRRVNFSDWLENETNIYWINGKAGSGKSVLMKFVCEHENTRKKLLIWAGEDKLVLGSFFFWNTGNELEKSQEGLLRSLSFEILRQCPELVAGIKSNRLEDLWCSDSTEVSYTITELTDLFRQLIEHPAKHVKFCFFIDGLDEYKGEPESIARVLETFGAITNIKLCLSSRPWTVFEEAFGQSNEFNLTVEYHTMDDIKLYVNEMLGSDKRFLMIRNKDPRYDELVTELVTKANGVFLWVYLVVDELRNNLSNKDSFEEFQQRVREFPDRLEPYFMRILTKVPKAYRQASSQALLACLEAEYPLDLLTVAFIFDRRYDCMSTSIEPMSDTAVENMLKDARIRLKARCLDLLEVTEFENFRTKWEGRTAVESDVAMNSIYVYQVDFLHRTVYDFLRQSEIYELIRSRVPESFEPCEAICQANLVSLKVIPHERWYFPGDIERILVRVLMYSQRHRARVGRSDKGFLLEVERATEELAKKCPIVYEMNHWHLKPSGKGSVLLCLAIRNGYTEFLSEKLADDPSLVKEVHGTPPLLLALGAPQLDCCPFLGLSEADADTVDVLLKYGANPMEMFNGKPIWAAFLGKMVVESQFADEKLSQTSHLRVVSSLVRAGSPLDVDVKVTELRMIIDSLNQKAGRGVHGSPQLSKSPYPKTPQKLKAVEILRVCFERTDVDHIMAIVAEPQRRAPFPNLFKWLIGT